MKGVRYTPAAAASLRRLDKQDRASLITDMEAYAAGNAGFDDAVAELEGIDASRLRSGVYRIIFTQSAHLITILDIGHRGEIYSHHPKRG